jgi:hypothetical protein
MTNRERVLSFLQSIAPRDASNAEIVGRTGIKPHQQIFMITRDQIKGVQAGHEWRFWCDGVENAASFALHARSPLQAMTTPNRNQTYDWDTTDSLDCRTGLTWVKLGRVMLDSDRLRFPKAPLQPGLYRFRTRGSAGDALYIGENGKPRAPLCAIRGPRALPASELAVKRKIPW